MSRKRYGQRAARVEGGWWHHPKVAGCSMAARGLWVSCVSYAADKVTDGEIPVFIVPALCPGEPAEPLFRELEACGLVTEKGGGSWQLHDWQEHNITRNEWESEKKRVRESMRKTRGKLRVTEEEPKTNAARNIAVTYGDVSTSTSTSLTTKKGGAEGPGSEPATGPLKDPPDATPTLHQRVELAFAAHQARAAPKAPRPKFGRVEYAKTADVVEWLEDAGGGKPDELLDASLRAFFADAKARKAGYPYAWWTTGAAAYANQGTGANAGDVVPADPLRAEQARLVKLLEVTYEPAKRSELTAQIDAIAAKRRKLSGAA